MVSSQTSCHGSELVTLEAAAGFEWHLLKQSLWLRTGHSGGCCWLWVALIEAVSMAQIWPLWRLLLVSSGSMRDGLGWFVEQENAQCWNMSFVCICLQYSRPNSAPLSSSSKFAAVLSDNSDCRVAVAERLYYKCEFDACYNTCCK